MSRTRAAAAVLIAAALCGAAATAAPDPAPAAARARAGACAFSQLRPCPLPASRTVALTGLLADLDAGARLMGLSDVTWAVAGPRRVRSALARVTDVTVRVTPRTRLFLEDADGVVMRVDEPGLMEVLDSSELPVVDVTGTVARGSALDAAGPVLVAATLRAQVADPAEEPAAEDEPVAEEDPADAAPDPAE